MSVGDEQLVAVEEVRLEACGDLYPGHSVGIVSAGQDVFHVERIGEHIGCLYLSEFDPEAWRATVHLLRLDGPVYLILALEAWESKDCGCVKTRTGYVKTWCGDHGRKYRERVARQSAGACPHDVLPEDGACVQCKADERALIQELNEDLRRLTT